jgi:hypothetical protein
LFFVSFFSIQMVERKDGGLVVTTQALRKQLIAGLQWQWP